MHGQHVRLDHVLERGDEGPVAHQLLVPPAEGGRELGADEHLVDRGVELDPREAMREGAGILGKQLGEVRVLEVADPVGHAEVAQVDDGNDAALLQPGERQIGELPVVRPCPRKVLCSGGP